MIEVPELLSVVFTLRYKGEEDPDRPLPHWWGKAVHALVLDIINQASPEKAEEIHDAPSGPPPFTASTLIGYRRDYGLSKDEEYRVRVTTLNQEVSGYLLPELGGGRLSAGADLTLDYLPFRIETVDWQGDVHPWAGSATYQALGAKWLSAEENPPRRVGFTFTSPTCFKSGGKYTPIPTASLIFHSLLLQWNEYAPITFPEDVRRYVEECLSLRRYKLSSRKVTLGKKFHRTGGVGKVTFVATHFDRYWLSVLHALAEYSLFAGVGKSTALGLGQARKIG